MSKTKSLIVFGLVAFSGQVVWGQAQDNCPDAQEICGLAGNTVGDAICCNIGSNVGATTDGPTTVTDPTFGDTPMGFDVWYEYTAYCDGKVTFDMCDVSPIFDSVLAVYTGQCAGTNGIGDLVFIAASDEGCAGQFPAGGPGFIELPNVTSGTKFVIQIGAYDAGQAVNFTGDFSICVSCGSAEANLLPTGDDVATTTGGGSSTTGGVDAVFTSVDSAGLFTADYVDTSTSSPDILNDVNFSLPGATPQLWNINYTGEFTPPVTLTLGYDDTGMSEADELGLQIQHSDGAGGWTELPSTVDINSNTITFQVFSFSFFVLGASAPDGGDPVPAVGGWALAVMVLTLVVGGTLVLRQRRAVV